jgi:hypothetical protein
MFLVILDKFDPNLMLINVNKLRPYFLDEKTQFIDKFEPMYWEGQKDTKMDDQDNNH